MTKTKTQPGATAHRLLRRTELEQVLGISRSTIYARLDPKSRHYDPDFPKPIKLGVTSIAFVESEAQDYISQLIAERAERVGA